MGQRGGNTRVMDMTEKEFQQSDAIRVLCIDDDPNVGQSLRRRFRKHRIPVLYAHCGRQGFWLAVSKLPDVIITDIRMPDGDGGYVLRKLSEDPRTAGIPVIVLTGLDDPNLEDEVEELGAVAIFQKPTPFRELFDEIEALMAEQPA